MKDIHLITGATGCVGLNLTKHLISQEKKVRVFVRNVGKFKNLFPNPNVEIHEGNVVNLKEVKNAMKDVSVVYHLAFVLGGVEGWNKQMSTKTNVEGTKNILEAAAVENVNQVIFTSSLMVYGIPSSVPIREDAPLNGKGTYAENKIECEKLLLSYYSKKDLPITILRLMSVFGPHMTYKFTLNMFKKLNENKAFITVGRGDNYVNFSHVDDITRALSLVSLNKNAYGEIFNIVGCGPIKINDLVKKFIGLTGSKSKTIHVPIPLAKFLTPFDRSLREHFHFFHKDMLLDGNKADEKIRFKPLISYKEGLLSVITWLNRESEK